MPEVVRSRFNYNVKKGITIGVQKYQSRSKTLRQTEFHLVDCFRHWENRENCIAKLREQTFTRRQQSILDYTVTNCHNWVKYLQKALRTYLQTPLAILTIPNVCIAFIGTSVLSLMLIELIKVIVSQYTTASFNF